MRIRPRGPAALLLGCLLLAACDGSPSSSGDPTPTVSFRYSGARSGSFSVTAPRPGPGPRTESFVEGVAADAGGFFVRGFFFRDGGASADAVIIEGPRAPGSYPLGGCGFDAVCVNVWGGLGAAVGPAPRNGERAFYVTQGTLTIDPPLRDGRIRGRFSGTAALTVYSDGNWLSDGEITISDGSFEADLLTQPAGT
jgi:hypothetical protein